MTFSILAPAMPASKPVLGSVRRADATADIGSLEHATLKQPLEFSLAEYNGNPTLRASVDSKLQTMQDYKQSKGLLWIKVTIKDSKKSPYTETGVYNGHQFGPNESSPTHFGIFLGSALGALMVPKGGRIKIEHYKPKSVEIQYQNDITKGSYGIAKLLHDMHKWYGSE